MDNTYILFPVPMLSIRDVRETILGRLLRSFFQDDEGHMPDGVDLMVMDPESAAEDWPELPTEMYDYAGIRGPRKVIERKLVEYLGCGWPDPETALEYLESFSFVEYQPTEADHAYNQGDRDPLPIMLNFYREDDDE